jgi:HAD superfamily hydrolase (TIGR01509 family)
MPGEFFSKRNLLVDLDGTLVDSSPAHARAFVEALSTSHPGLAESFDYKKVAGLPTRDTFLSLGIAEEPELSDLIRRKQALYRAALDRGEVAAFPGATAFLAQLHAQGRRFFLVTGASRVSAQRILESAALARYFSGMITADDVPRGKPAPEPYLAALEKHDLNRNESIAIEDGEHGVHSAQAAKLDVITIHSENEFADLPHARNFTELATFFAR